MLVKVMVMIEVIKMLVMVMIKMLVIVLVMIVVLKMLVLVMVTIVVLKKLVFGDGGDKAAGDSDGDDRGDKVPVMETRG